MKRRDFIQTTITAAALAGAGMASRGATAGDAAGAGAKAREYYEWRTYLLKTPAQVERLETYFAKAAIPALNRLGSKPVGVFREMDKPEATKLFVLIPHPTLEAFGAVPGLLAKDEEYQRAASDYIGATKSDPAYARIESSLMVAFSGMPRIELPPYSVARKARMFEVRIYEAHSEAKNLRKVAMFDDGEIQIMRDTGLSPVFYGHTIIGTKVPNLTYMLSAENKDEHKKHWGSFGGHPEWKRIKDLPIYADTVSDITNFFIVPSDCSQI